MTYTYLPGSWILQNIRLTLFYGRAVNNIDIGAYIIYAQNKNQS